MGIVFSLFCKDKGRIWELPDDLLIKILSFLPTKIAVSTSVLSKQWEFLWMWSPKIECADFDRVTRPPISRSLRYEEFMDQNLPLHRAPVESLVLLVHDNRGLIKPEKTKQWVGIVVSHFLRELEISYSRNNDVLSLPISLYTCVSLMTLKLVGAILVDVPQTACLPSLKTLSLLHVKYSNEDSIRLLLSHCPVLEDLSISRGHPSDNVRALVVNLPSLQRLSLTITRDCSSDKYVIVTPSLKYFKLFDYTDFSSYLIKPMTKLEEADIYVQNIIEKILESVTSVRRLKLRAMFNSADESVYRAGIVFNQLEHLTLHIHNHFWSKCLIWLLGNSPKLRVLKVDVPAWLAEWDEYEPGNWDIKQSPVPECLLRSLETFEFLGYSRRQEEDDFLSFFRKHVRILKEYQVKYKFMDI